MMYGHRASDGTLAIWRYRECYDRWVGWNMVFCSPIANDDPVMFRIVDDECPPIPDRSSGTLVAFMKEYFMRTRRWG